MTTFRNFFEVTAQLECHFKGHPVWYSIAIHRWPTATIEKSTLIQILNDLCEDNPELQNIYDNSLVSAVGHDDGTQSCVDTISEKPAVQHRNQPISQVVLVKGGDLTVRKGTSIILEVREKSDHVPGSTILSSLLKSNDRFND